MIVHQAFCWSIGGLETLTILYSRVAAPYPTNAIHIPLENQTKDELVSNEDSQDCSDDPGGN